MKMAGGLFLASAIQENVYVGNGNGHRMLIDYIQKQIFLNIKSSTHKQANRQGPLKAIKTGKFSEINRQN